jgi:HK97 gp10 family phage protein
MAKVKGLGKLIAALDDAEDEIEDDVDFILKKRSEQFRADTVKEARRVMTKGYWTGNLARMVEDTKRGKLSYLITSNAHYSGFLEYGTRFMAPETFMYQIYQKYDKQIKADIERLINS